MKKRLIQISLPMTALTVLITAALVAEVCLPGAWLSRLPLILPLCAAVFVVVTCAAVLLLKRAIRTVNPDSRDFPDYDELRPLLRRIDEQKTQLRDRRDELEDRERKLNAITVNMTEGLVVLDGAGIVLLMNRAAARMLGAGENDTAGKHIVAVNQNNLLQAAVHSALGGSPSRELISLGGMKLQAIANPVVVDGAAHGAVLMLLNVTERLAAEEMRREFSANVSHELKTPITSISGYAELMMTGIARQEDVPLLSEKIYHEASRLLALIEDIIKLSRLDEDSVGSVRQNISLLRAAEAVGERLMPKAEANAVQLLVSGEDAHVLGDAQLIDEMIANMADNAIKYNRPGGHVSVTVGSRGSAPFVTVTDDGIGIAPEHMERVFERFYRVDKSHSKETGGTGLGLSIVKHGAAWHRARVEAQSVPDRGTTITIVFDGKGGHD
ncbi:MAG: ATP-binding protein [Oscillospiraceae bacterium]